MVLKSLKKIALVTLVSAPFVWLGNGLYREIKSDLEYTDRMRGMTYQEVIEDVKTPEQAERYLRTFLSYESDRENFGEQDYIASFKRIHENEGDDCDGGALAAAALLSDNGHPPLLLCMYGQEHSLENFGGHGIYIYQQNGKWGTLGINVVDCQTPKYSSVEEIVREYGYNKFNIMNIAEEYPDWLANNTNMNQRIYRPDLAEMLK